MKPEPSDFPTLYRKAVESHLIQSSLPDPEQIQTIASAATSAKLTTTRLSIIHETTLALEILPKLHPKQRPNAINRSSHFLATILSNIATSRPGPNPLHHDVASLATHSLHHFETIRKSRLEIDRRKKTETNLRNSRSAKDTSLKECVRLKKHLQHLSRQILTTQEQERKKISRELQDVVAQAIVSINIRLATLKKQSALNTRGLESDIIATQQIVANSADIVQKFARELRPAVLDDFGLIPALHAYMKAFTSRTGIRTDLASFAQIEQLAINLRTTLFRVTQDALTNIARNADASSAHVSILKKTSSVCLSINDDGKPPTAGKKTSLTPIRKPLGLLGMRERIEMIGGVFNIRSSPDHGTTILAEIPWHPNKIPLQS
jgi:signal transduction histidine kinase